MKATISLLKKSKQEKYIRESMGRAWDEVKEAEHVGRPLPNAYDLIAQL